MQRGESVHAYRYRITVRGKLGHAALEAFDGMRTTYDAGRTALVVDLDQAALHGVLHRIYALALELVSVEQVE
jgi:hypothetical protein